MIVVALGQNALVPYAMILINWVAVVTCTALLAVLLVLPLVLCDRRYGLRCPRCCRSVTLSCPQAKVLRSGKCSRCGAVLFEAANTVGTA